MSHSPLTRLHQELGFDSDASGMLVFAQLKQVSQRWLQRVHAALERHGFEPDLSETIIAIFRSQRADGLTAPTDTSARLNIPKTTLTARLRRLEVLGWIDRPTSAQDRRSLPISITPAGTEALKDIVRIYANACQPLATLKPHLDELLTAEQELTP